MKFFTTIAAIFLLVPLSASAETVLRIADSVNVTEDQVVNGDFYVLAEPVTVSGVIEGDASIVAAEVTLNGEVQGDIFALTESAQIHATVTDDVRIAGGDVTIAEYVGGDVFVLAAGSLTVLSTAEIAGDIFFYGTEAEINGVVGGSIFGTSERLRIDAPIGGRIDVVAMDQLVLGGRADVSGSVSYSSQNELVRAQESVVVGEVSKRETLPATVPSETPFYFLVLYAFSVLILFALTKSKLQFFAGITGPQFSRNGLIGLVAIIFVPFALLPMFLSVIGALLGVVVLNLFVAAILISLLIIPIWVGSHIGRLAFASPEITLMNTFLGLIVVALLPVIPVIGGLILLTLCIVVYGTLVRSLYRWLV